MNDAERLPDAPAGWPFPLSATLLWSLVAVVLSQAAPFAARFLFPALSGGRDPAGHIGLIFSIGMILAAPIMYGVLRLACRQRNASVKETLALRAPGGRETLVWLVAVGALIGLTALASQYVDEPESVNQFSEKIWTSAGSRVLLILAVCLATPFTEEILFRGFLFGGLLHGTGMSKGVVVVVTALVWAVLHGQYQGYALLVVFLNGIVLGLARLCTGSAVPTIAMHAVINAVATIQISLLVD